MNNQIQIYEHILNVLKDLLDEKYTLAARLQREAEQRFAEIAHEDALRAQLPGAVYINRQSVYLLEHLKIEEVKFSISEIKKFIELYLLYLNSEIQAI